MTRRRKIAIAIATPLLTCIVATVAFIQGVMYANRKATIRIANDGCFYTVSALRAFKEPEKRNLTVLFDHGMDQCASKLADMCLSHPHEIERMHYNILLQVQNYRNRYGRDPQRAMEPNNGEVDGKIAAALTYLESIHDTNDWAPFKFDFESGTVKIQ